MQPEKEPENRHARPYGDTLFLVNTSKSPDVQMIRTIRNLCSGYKRCNFVNAGARWYNAAMVMLKDVADPSSEELYDLVCLLSKVPIPNTQFNQYSLDVEKALVNAPSRGLSVTKLINQPSRPFNVVYIDPHICDLNQWPRETLQYHTWYIHHETRLTNEGLEPDLAYGDLSGIEITAALRTHMEDMRFNLG